MGDALRVCLQQKYADFNGRATRSEYWWFALANFVVYLVLYILAIAVHPLLFLVVLYGLAVIVPSLAVAARRLHDSGKSGWLLLLGLIPIVGGIIVLVFALLPSDPGQNQYGPQPVWPPTGTSTAVTAY